MQANEGLPHLLQDLLKKWTCLHEWDFVIEHAHLSLIGSSMSTYQCYVCKKCGKFKKIRT